MAIDTTGPRTRRALLGAGLGAVAASVVASLGHPEQAAAASSVVLGATNDATTPTVIRDNANDSAAVAISGRVTHVTGSTASAGVKGQDDGTNGTGVAGYATNGTTARGVYGQSTAGRGVEGASSTGIGIYGHSPSGKGVQGNSTSGVGVLGVSASGYGLQGTSTSSWAIRGDSVGGGISGHSSGGIGVSGQSGSAPGVQGTSISDYGVLGDSPAGGVFGRSTNDNGVFGQTASGLASGVYGENTSPHGGYGVAGRSSSTGAGVLGDSAVVNGTGVYGNSIGDTGSGVYGTADGANGFAVYGRATADGGSAIYGQQDFFAAWAGYFLGAVTVTGTFTSPAPIIQLDHPDAPADRYYQRVPVGSFEQVSVIGGNAVTGTDGRVTVKVPLLFARYHTDIRYQFTPFGPAQQLYVARELDTKGRFVIASEQPGLRVSWQLTGVRSDPAALKQPLRVDAAKPARYRGRYIQPTLYGQPGSKSLVAPRQQPRPAGPSHHRKAPPRPR